MSELPPLPPNPGMVSSVTGLTYYGDDQMRAYTQAAIAALEAENQRLREVVSKVNDRCDHLGMSLGEIKSERDALRAECAELRKERDAPGATIAPEHIDALNAMSEQAVERLRDDMRCAARYRWLRAQDWESGDLFVVAGGHRRVKLGTDCPSLFRLDEAIDAAMEGQEP